MVSTADSRQSVEINFDDVLDRFGRVIVPFADERDAPPAQEDAEISPWILPTADLGPPTPPPKSPIESHQAPTQQSSISLFKSSLHGSLASIGYRQNSSGNSRRTPRVSESRSTLQAPNNHKKRFADSDNDSVKTGGGLNGSSAHAGDVRKANSFNFLAKLRKSASKPRIRADDDPIDPNHAPSRIVVPPVPLSSKSKGKKKAKGPPSPPPKDGEDMSLIFTGDLDIGNMEGIVDFNNLASAGRSSSSTNGYVYETHSQSDHSFQQHSYYLNADEFSNPFSPNTSSEDKRKGIVPRVPLKSIMAPQPPNSLLYGQNGANSPAWSPPESWAVEKGRDGTPDIAEVSDENESEFEQGSSSIPRTPANIYRLGEDRYRKKSRNLGGESFSSMTPSKSGQTYRMRIYRPNQTYHVVAIDLDTTVASLTAKLNRKLEDNRVPHNLYLKEQGRERILEGHERPAAIVRLRMHQAGYDEDDALQLLGPESLGILCRFYYKSQLLAGEEQPVISSKSSVDLSGKGLRTIPPAVHSIAEEIKTLRLSRNPMIEIPLDFIQSCVHLTDLQLTHMSMKKLPASLRHSESLRRLDISSNSIRDFTDAFLDRITGLNAIFASNNCLDTVPWYLGRMKKLEIINISNNKFKMFPPVLLTIANLKELDISFNMITDLPENVGSMVALQKFILVGNNIQRFPESVKSLENLDYLDCRRNQISDISPVCVLPKIRSILADHNMVHGLDLRVGPNLTNLRALYNDITKLTLVPGPEGHLPFNLSVLDLSYAKMTSLDANVITQLLNLRVLKLDHNTLRCIPDCIGDLQLLDTISCTFNKLDALPSTIGNLRRLGILTAHNNNIAAIPESIWNCAFLKKINLSSNCIRTWPDPPAMPVPDIIVNDANGNFLAPVAFDRKASLSSVSPVRHAPALVNSLEHLSLGENMLGDGGGIHPLIFFKSLRLLDISYNNIQELPLHFFTNMTELQELHLSGNKLGSLPVEDFDRLKELSIIYLNGNRLQTLPQELGTLPNLTTLDVGSNLLKYNVNNYEFDWNWNFNPTLRFLNLSGNKRLQIKGEISANLRSPKPFTQMSGFTKLSQLRVLGLMDVTVTMAGHGGVDIPDENADRRVRTSPSIICGMGYGIADSAGSKDHYQYMLDLVHESPSQNVAMVAMFGSSKPPVGLRHGSSPNRLSKYLHDNFVDMFKTQMKALESTLVPETEDACICKALTWTYMKLNQDLYEMLLNGARKNSQASLTAQTNSETQYSRTGVSAVSAYFANGKVYVANLGDALVVAARRGGIIDSLSRKHDPYDPEEAVRIRAAEGYITPSGLVNEESPSSRGFGHFQMFPPIIARPHSQVYVLDDGVEFIIIASHGLWDCMTPTNAVDVARMEFRQTSDPMKAAAKLRDFAVCYGAEGSTMVMVLIVADLLNNRSRQGTLEIVNPLEYRPAKKSSDLRDRTLIRLDDEIDAPVGNVTLVFTDIKNSTHLWEVNPGMPSAMRQHNFLLRRQLRRCGGYEVKTEGDSFMCSFPSPLSAAWWCLEVQSLLLVEAWPLEILESEDGKAVYDDQDRLIARGLSVRMGIHSGAPLCEPDLITHRMDYFGVMVSRAARIMSKALGGQIMCSMEIIRDIREQVLEADPDRDSNTTPIALAVESIRRLGVEMFDIGDVKLKGIELAEPLVAIYPRGLEGRYGFNEPVQDISSLQALAAQALDLGMVCLKMEAVSVGRVFRPITDPTASIQLTGAGPDQTDPRIYFANPKLLLPPISEAMTEAELYTIMEGLLVRLNNAMEGIYTFYKVPSRQFPLITTTQPEQILTPSDILLAALLRDGVIDQATAKKYTSPPLSIDMSS